MTKVIYPASRRGAEELGCLKRRLTFSLGSFQNPECNGFGKLRVLNEEIVDPGMGIPLHPHENMEIITLPISGAVRHQDSFGNKNIIGKGEIHIMSAGRGVTHAEHNNSEFELAHFIQIWILPQQVNLPLRYEQKKFNFELPNQALTLLASPNQNTTALQIHQNAYLSALCLEPGETYHYEKYDSTNEIFLFILDGYLKLDGITLQTGDGAGIIDENPLRIEAAMSTNALCIEVPLGRLD